MSCRWNTTKSSACSIVSVAVAAPKARRPLRGVVRVARHAVFGGDAGPGHLEQVELRGHLEGSRHRFYSQDLINNLFLHPYTRIDFVQKDLDVSRLTDDES